MLHHGCIYLAKYNMFQMYDTFQCFLSSSTALKTKTSPFGGDFASYPPQGFRPARKKRQRDWDWSPGRWSHFAKGICSERHWRSFCNPLKYSGQILCKKITSTGLSMTNKKETTQPKSGLQAARHLQGRGELQMFFCSCEACEDYRTAWLLCLLRVHIEKKSVWIGNLLRSTDAKLENCPSFAGGTSHLQIPRWACCWEVHDVVLRSIMNIMPHTCFKIFCYCASQSVCLCVCVCVPLMQQNARLFALGPKKHCKSVVFTRISRGQISSQL